MIRRIDVFLHSWRNMAGCALALVGVVLHLAGLVTGLLWVPIVIGLYLLGYRVTPAESKLSLDLDGSGDSPADAEIEGSLDRLLASISGRVPNDIYYRVSSIRDTILVTLGTNGARRATGALASDPNLYLIRQTAVSYLPEALDAYLNLSLTSRDRAIGGRKSAHDILLNQLDLMDQKMAQVTEAMMAHDTDPLEAHGRFLAEKFGTSALNLDNNGDPIVIGSADLSSSLRPRLNRIGEQCLTIATGLESGTMSVYTARKSFTGLMEGANDPMALKADERLAMGDRNGAAKAIRRLKIVGIGVIPGRFVPEEAARFRFRVH